MAENENENEELKSTVEPDETFEEKMARIQEILGQQKTEVIGRKDGEDTEEAPELTEAAVDPQAETNEESEVADSEEENENSSADESESAEESTSESSEEDSSSESASSVEESEIPADEEKDTVPAPVSADKVESEKKKRKVWPVITIVIILLLIAAGVFAAMQHKNTANKTESSSVAKSSAVSKSEESSSSSSSSEASTSASSSTPKQSTSAPTAPTRAQLIASVNHAGERVALDPNVTGNEPEFAFADNLKSSFIELMQQKGYIQGNNYKLIPASILSGQGYYNLYDGNGNYVGSINNSNGYLYMRQ